MDKTLFKQKLEPLGYLKRKWRGSTPDDEAAWEEQVLKLFPKDHTCPPCTEAEFIWKRGKWTRKCLCCGEKTQVSSIFTK
jgi:hypothetical protein